jgi:hypothetical protein
MRGKKWYQTISNVWLNLKRMLGLSYGADKFLTVGYYGSAGVSAVFPIITSYIYKLLLDHIIAGQKIAPTVPVIIVSILSLRYLSNWCWDFVSWVLKETYFDYLVRYKMQNTLNNLFVNKMVTIDIYPPFGKFQHSGFDYEGSRYAYLAAA